MVILNNPHRVSVGEWIGEYEKIDRGVCCRKRIMTIINRTTTVLLIYFMTTDDLSTILLREEEKEKNDFLPGEFLNDTQKKCYGKASEVLLQIKLRIRRRRRRQSR